MLRLVLFLLVVAAVASGLAWLADRPGELVVNWQDYRIETSVFRAVVIFAGVVGLSVLAYSILRQLWMSPAALGTYFNRRRQKRGLESLSAGMIAVGAGDRTLATRYAVQARKALPNEPMTHLLRAQAAQLTGDKATARRIFEAMLGSPDTEQLGLRGLFLEAQRESEPEAARQFAERALRLNPKLSWPVEALFDLQCKAADWSGALETLAVAKRHNQIEKPLADRRRAVLLTAQAQLAEDGDPERALGLALEAHGLAPDLVPAAAIAGRLLASRGNTPRATKVLQKTWQRSPHPDLAEAYAFARLGDSPRDRLLRVKQLAALYPTSVESSVAIAKAAIEAKDFDEGRSALEGLRDERMSHRVCLLMARIEGEQLGDKGRVREWLARAVNAARDPVWTADGIVSDRWSPVSPVTGQLDAFQWKVAVEAMDKSEGELLARKLDELVALGAPVEPAAPVAAEVLAPEAPAQPPERTDKMHEAAPAPTASRTAEPAQVVASTAMPAAAKEPAEPAAAALSCPPARVSKPAAAAAEAPTRASTETMVGGAAEAKTTTKPPAPEAQPETVKVKRAADAATAPVSPSAARPAASAASGKTGRDGKGGEPRIFVPPPAPDDPGTEAAEAGEGGDVPAPVRGAYRITT